MINFLTFSSVLSLLGCLALGLLYAWLLYGQLKHLSRGLRLGLSVLRVLSISLISWMLFAPLFRHTSYTPEKPIIVLAHDNSLSVAQIKPSGFDMKKYERDMKELEQRLSSKYEVLSYSFGDSIKSGLDFSGQGKLSNGAALIAQLKDKVLNRNLGAVLIASDGIFNRGGNPLYDLKQFNAPVYTIAMGDTIPKKDVLIADVSYNDIAYLDNDFTLDVQVQAYQAKGEIARLVVEENGIKIHEEPISLSSSAFTRPVPVKIKASKVGVHQYLIRVSNLSNEITLYNNSQRVFVEVIDARQKVLLVSGSPHPDIAVLKQAIEENKHYEVTLSMGDEVNSLEVGKFNMAILYQLPSQNFNASAFLSKIKSTKLPIWHILGAQSNVNEFNSLQALVKINRANGSTQEVFPLTVANFTLFNLDSKSTDQFSSYAPLYSPFGNLAISGTYSALLNQKIGRVNTQNPLFFFVTNEGLKSSYLIGEGLWRWRLEEAKDPQSQPLVNELISKTVQYLSVKDDKRKFKVYTSKPTYDESEPVILNANLYNDSYEAVNTEDVILQVKSANGKVFNYNFSKSGSGYRLDAGTLPSGSYSYVATTSLGSQKYTATGSFYVNALITEYQQTIANHQLLYTMADQNGGKMYMPDQLLALVNELEKHEQIKTLRYEDRTYHELIDFKWIFALVVLLLSIEWFLRKRNGEV
ncbi:MAG: hypothetical protein EOO90_05640 [Pedobacter sp.]|nr:MAG: hypothetical protein EOO90_05640 [Pedobacter sp.]